jgi:ABC-2 type transport system permease protein
VTGTLDHPGRVPEVRPRAAVGAAAPGHRRHARRRPRRSLRAAARLYARLTWRTAAIMSAVMAGYVALEMLGYRTAYPDGVSPLQFVLFEDNPAVRMMNGVPVALDTAGGFTVWDGGWIMQIVVAVWAVLTASRLLRGEEDLDRTDLVLAAPVRATGVTAVVVSVVVAEAALIGLAAAVTMGLAGEAWTGSLLFGAGLAGAGATFGAATAVVSQLVEVRRRVVGLGAGLLGAAYVARMIGNSADSRTWVRWWTPMGWVDQIQPFGADDALAVVPVVLVPAALGFLAVRLRGARDTGGALLAPESSGRSHLRLLSSPLAFAWRSHRATLAGWAVGLGAVAAVLGALVTTMIEWISGDEGYQEVLATIGLEEAVTVQGFVALLALVFGLAIAVQAVWRIGAARAEEEGSRLDAILARPVGRLRWLGGHVLLAGAGALLLTLAVGVATWAGAVLAGSSVLSLSDAVTSSLNTLPVVVLVAGLAVGVYGLAPRLTVPVPLALTLASFVLYLLGPALQWPSWALDVSPFTHLAMVPAEPWATASAVVMCALGLALAAVGALAFRRRDVGTG